MDNLAILLLLLGSSDVVLSTIQCGGGGWIDEVNKQLPIYEGLHEVANLTLDCVAVTLATIAVHLHAEGVADKIQKDDWCKYTSYTWDGYTKTWLKRYLIPKLPWDKIAQTALFHRNTKYGCAATYAKKTFHYYFYIACIYARTSPDVPCYIEWDIPEKLKNLH